MEQQKEKSLPLAIGLNLLAPGIGYMYMGKIIIGIAAFLLIIGIYTQATMDTFIYSWLGMNVIMALDMVILGKKRETETVNKTMVKCPMCAEWVQKDAKICKHCKSLLEQQTITEPGIQNNEKGKKALLILIAAGLFIVLSLIVYMATLGSKAHGFEIVKEGHLQFFGNEKTVEEVLQHIADGTVVWSAAKLVSPVELSKTHYLVEAKFSILKKAIEKEPLLALYLGGMSKEVVLNLQFLVEKEAPNFTLYSGSVNDISTSSENMLGLLRDIYVLKNMMIAEESKEVEKNKFKQAVLDVQNIATGIEAYRAETGLPPDQLDVLVPVHLAALPSLDPWGNSYIYQKSGEHAGIASGGSDGVFKGFDQPHPNRSREQGGDILMIDGMFIEEPVDFYSSSVSSEDQNQDMGQTFLISDHTVLGLGSGMTVAEVEQIIGKENVRIEKEEKSIEGEIYEEMVLKVFLSGESQPIIKATLSEEGKLGRIYALDRRCRTAENISIASTFGEIKKAYPDLQYEWIEGFHVWSEQAGYSFELADRGMQPTDSSRIVSICL